MNRTRHLVGLLWKEATTEARVRLTYLGETGSSRLCRPSSEQCPYISRAACRTPHARSGWQTLRYAPRRLISRWLDSQIHHRNSDPLGAVVCIEVRAAPYGEPIRAHTCDRDSFRLITWTNRPCDRGRPDQPLSAGKPHSRSSQMSHITTRGSSAPM